MLVTSTMKFSLPNYELGIVRMALRRQRLKVRILSSAPLPSLDFLQLTAKNVAQDLKS